VIDDGLPLEGWSHGDVQHVQAPEFTTLQSHALKVSIDGDLVIGLPFFLVLGKILYSRYMQNSRLIPRSPPSFFVCIWESLGTRP